MPKFKFPYHFAIIVIVMSFGPILVGQLIRLLGNDSDQLQQARTELCRHIASECSMRLPEKQMLEFQQVCDEALQSDVGLKSLRVVRSDGAVLYESEDHSTYWKLKANEHSTAEQVRIPLMQGKNVNAELEMAFEPISRSWWEFVIYVLLVVAVGLGLNYAYIKSAVLKFLHFHSSKTVVPQKVRNTLDTLVGGVVILDGHGKILLANDSFAKYVSLPVTDLTQKSLGDFAWIKECDVEWPWDYALREKSQQAGTKLQMTNEGKEPTPVRTFMVNATPVYDSQEGFSGALVSFEDITEMEVQRQHLLKLLSDLEASKEQIDRQNQVLHELASRDGLTGALNRRALFDKLESIWDAKYVGEADRGLSVILLDVDRFKHLNDTHGHLVGDKVLKDIAKTILRVVDDRGWFARYGGEEFCIVFERSTLKNALDLAEEVRKALEVEHLNPYKVTASIGVANSTAGATSYLQLMEQADRALYASKQKGRNCVQAWSVQLEQDTVQQSQLRQSDRLRVHEEVESRISYHAVITLNSAISSRYPEVVLHSHRVSEICVAMARSWLPASKLYLLESAALLHDVGVMSLGNYQPKTNGEYSIDSGFDSASHALANAGAQILRAAFQCRELVDILQFQATPFVTETESADRIKDCPLPVGSRILAIANAYDQLVHSSGLSHAQAIAEMLADRNQRFDPLWLNRLAVLGAVAIEGAKDEMETSEASMLMFGYQVDRVIHCLETRRYEELRMRLKQLESAVEKFNVPKISEMLKLLSQEVAAMSKDDWESLVPTFRDLVEICLTIQRAYLKTHVSGLQETTLKPNSPQMA